MGIKEGMEVDGTDSELYSMVDIGIDNIKHMDSRETVVYRMFNQGGNFATPLTGPNIPQRLLL
jgi:hypothetical protein